jgi:signal transduction histidine kinase
LYIYVLDLNGKILAHPRVELVGKDFMAVKDADSKLSAVGLVKMDKDKGNVWVDTSGKTSSTKRLTTKPFILRRSMM